jgi:hydroxymethylpyrimidine pyrophosphatase-like HAD family hydrolase
MLDAAAISERSEPAVLEAGRRWGHRVLLASGRNLRRVASIKGFVTAAGPG